MISSSIIPSHKIAEWILSCVDNLLVALHLSRSQTMEEVVYTAMIIAAALIAGWVTRKIIVVVIRRVLTLRDSDVTHDLLQQRLFTRCSHVIPPLIFLAFIPFAFQADPSTLHIIMRIVVAYGLITIGIALTAIATFVWTRYDKRENTVNHPLRGVLNVAKGIIWIVITIIVVSVLIDKSPAYLLTGLGAFAAALMLVFKDSILGFVAGIQLSQNDMLRVGDWIVVPSTIANGIVVDVTLTVVKIRNWDNTIVMLPPYTLVSTSFQNWRGMQDSGCRQIEREIYLDNATIRPLAEGEADKIAQQLPLLKEFVDKGQKTVYNTAKAGVNGTMETNLGLFRAYMCLYLIHHPEISDTSQILVRLRQPMYYGTPLQIYCYTSTTAWAAYEAIQSQIFEHMAAVAPIFGLMIYNYADGSDLIIHQAPVTPTPAIAPSPGSQATAITTESTTTENPATPQSK